jgi:alanine dehydrogenase
MRVGVPREVKVDEYRVALTPAGADALVDAGHTAAVESTAGEGAGFPDAAYRAVGATIVDGAEAWGADLVLKVKEPQPEEFTLLTPDSALFTYLHLAANPGVADALMRAGTLAIAYETVEDAGGRLPLLAPMSEIAGRLSVQAGAKHLEKPLGGRGVLLGGVAGVAPGNVVVLGGGIVGINAAMVAVGMQAHVTVLDVDLNRLRDLELALAGRVTFIYSTRLAIAELIRDADLVVGAVLVPGAKAPRLVTRDMLGTMRPGAVIVDVAVDQGGCVETTRPTTHSDPTYVIDGVIHYCVANMPGAVPVTSTQALCNATLPYVLTLANEGVVAAVERHPSLRPGVNVRDGELVNATVAEALAER